jgi:HSP20 family molecular chaperone IbpA
MREQIKTEVSYMSRNEKNFLSTVLQPWNLWPFKDEWSKELTNQSSLLATDIEEMDNSYQMTVDVPGIKKDNISIHLDNGYLTIQVKAQEDEKDHQGFYHRERYEEASRTYFVGDGLKEADFKAKLENGTLILTFPKKEKAPNDSGRILIE